MKITNGYFTETDNMVSAVIEDIERKVGKLTTAYLILGRLIWLSVFGFITIVIFGNLNIISGSAYKAGWIISSISEITFVVTFIRTRRKLIELLIVRSSIETGDVEVRLTEVDENGKITKTMEGNEAKEMFGLKISEIIENKPEYTADEKFKVVVKNVIPTAIVSIEDCLEKNEISLVSKSSSALNKTITLLFSELNKAKAARNVLDAAGYSVGHAESVG